MASAFQTVKTGRKPAVLGALLFFEQYYKAHGQGVPYDIEELLLAFAERTDSRGLAVGALNVLVEAGNIDESEALSLIYDWKREHYYGVPKEEL